MNRVECLRTIYDCTKPGVITGRTRGPLFVVSLGKTRIIWNSLYRGEGSMYLHSMGYITPYALGLALALPDRAVITIDGDGSIFLNLGVLTTIAAYAPKNLIVIIVDNEMYEATGRFPTPSGKKASLERIAKGCGILNACALETPERLALNLHRALKAEDGPFFIDAKVKDEEDLSLPSTTMDGKENKYRFIRHIERTEKISVFEQPSTQA